VYQKLRRLLNARIDSPASIEEIPPSHPAGFVREMNKRRQLELLQTSWAA
jgi:hypothetical protein